MPAAAWAAACAASRSRLACDGTSGLCWYSSTYSCPDNAWMARMTSSVTLRHVARSSCMPQYCEKSRGGPTMAAVGVKSFILPPFG